MPGDGAGRTRLQVWWVNVGRHLDERGSLVFWLSGVCANKQFPLTGGLLPGASGLPQLPVAFGVPQSFAVTGDGSQNGPEANATNGGVQIDIPRDVFFDFRGEQLDNVALNNIDPTDLTSPQLPSGLRVYNTPYGNEDPDRGNAYFYRNSALYNTTGGAYHAFDVNGSPVYPNPNTFQLFTFGADGVAANIALSDTSDPVRSGFNSDNITNFANGRLETFDWRESLDLGQ